MKKLTIEQGVILTGFTGKLCAPLSDFHADVEKRLGRPVFTHEFANKEMSEQLREEYRADFIAMMPEGFS